MERRRDVASEWEGKDGLNLVADLGRHGGGGISGGGSGAGGAAHCLMFILNRS